MYRVGEGGKKEERQTQRNEGDWEYMHAYVHMYTHIYILNTYKDSKKIRRKNVNKENMGKRNTNETTRTGVDKSRFSFLLSFFQTRPFSFNDFVLISVFPVAFASPLLYRMYPYPLCMFICFPLCVLS